MYTARANVAFVITVLSSISLLLTVRFGTIAASGFVGLWALYFVAWPAAIDVLFRTLLPWLLPLFALASYTWSEIPNISARNATEWLATVAVGVAMASVVPIERLLIAWMLALIPVVIVGGLVGGSQFTETGEFAMTGLFGSKNNFALHICEMFFVCCAVLANARQAQLWRFVAFLACMAALLLLWRAKSVGALVVFVPSLLMMGAVIGLSRISRHRHGIVVIGTLFIGLLSVAVIAPVVVQAQDAMLSTVGKTENLTGRGLLWQRAGVLIEQRPALGVGYSAFWVQGNPEAEALWQAENIPSRGGFHFHSFYYETLIELGYIGMIVALMVLIPTSIAVLAWGVRQPGPESGFFCGIMVFLWLRSFVELDLLGGFAMNTLLIPVAWVAAMGGGRQCQR